MSWAGRKRWPQFALYFYIQRGDPSRSVLMILSQSIACCLRHSDKNHKTVFWLLGTRPPSRGFGVVTVVRLAENAFRLLSLIKKKTKAMAGRIQVPVSAGLCRSLPGQPTTFDTRKRE